MAHPRLHIVGGVTTPPTTTAFEPRALPARPGPLEQALRGLWTRRVRARLLHPRHWLDLVHLRRHYDPVELRAGELQRDFPVGRLPDCENCEDGCCTGPSRVVLLRLVDVAALVDAGLQDMISQDKPAFARRELARSPALADMLHSDAWQQLPVLRQDATRTCMMLTADGRCGAHPFWPLSCARFPYSVDVWNQRVFYAASCRSAVQDVSRPGRRRETQLVDAAVDAYNQRLRDAVLMRVARAELTELGLDRFVRWPHARTKPSPPA